jgi:CheY-like chemotaxis protein
MNVLLCDADASERLMVKRMLEDTFGCVAHECADGVEALELLSRDTFAFAVLDLDAPGLSGLETVTEIRASAVTKDLPVLILSSQRDEDDIVKLMQLGIADYLVKPLQPASFIAKVERIVRSLPEGGSSPAADLGKLSPRSPALLADPNLDFRFFFAREVERYGRIIQADSGAAALAAFRRTPVGLVFLGGDLGMVNAERTAYKLRELRPQGLRIVRIVDKGMHVAAVPPFDAVVGRSYVPDALRQSIRPFVTLNGPFPALATLVPEIRELVDSAATQVFGVMFNAEIGLSLTKAPLQPAFSSVVELDLEDRLSLAIGVHLPRGVAAAAASRMIGVAPADAGDEDCLSVAGELSNMVSGRVHARLRERSLKSVCRLPKMATQQPLPSISEENGLVRRFSMPAAGGFYVSLLVKEPAAAAKAAARRTWKPAATEPVEADAPEESAESVAAAGADGPEPATPAEPTVTSAAE